VAKGFARRYLIDYNKMTTPTACLESFCVLLHVAAVLDWDVQQVNIKTAFLHGILPKSESVFMEQCLSFEAPGKEDWVMCLMKSIYSMKQASCIWNQTFHKSIIEFGFQRLPNKWCVYRRQTVTGITIFAVHIDNIIVISSLPEENDRFKFKLQTKWEISDLGPVKYALGIAISRNRETRTVQLSQTALINWIVEQFGQQDANPNDIPMVVCEQITCSDKFLPIPPHIVAWAEHIPYCSLIGSLNYLAVGTQLDITFAVGCLATVLNCYRSEHYTCRALP
jgi:hypothetical protein